MSVSTMAYKVREQGMACNCALARTTPVLERKQMCYSARDHVIHRPFSPTCQLRPPEQ